MTPKARAFGRLERFLEESRVETRFSSVTVQAQDLEIVECVGLDDGPRNDMVQVKESVLDLQRFLAPKAKTLLSSKDTWKVSLRDSWTIHVLTFRVCFVLPLSK